MRSNAAVKEEDDVEATFLLDSLPPDVLINVLRRVPVSLRLCECSFMCRAWHAGAAAACDNIQVVPPKGEFGTASFDSWLLQHGSKLKTLTPSRRWTSQQPLEALLPFQQLHSLTKLWATNATISASDCAVASAADTGSTSTSSSGGGSANPLSALTNLSELSLSQQRVRRARGAAVPACAWGVTHAAAAGVRVIQGLERTASQPMQRLLVVLAGMCQLRHLHLSLFLSNPTGEVETQWDALAASTQLTYLHYDGMAWDPVCALDPATPLDLLQALHLDSAHQWRDDYSCMDTHGLQHLMQCCPGLQQLQLGAAVDNDADLSPLLQLRHLTALGVCMDMSERTARRLAALTGLKSLTIPTPILLEEVLVHLAKLQNLNSLSLQVDKDWAANLLDISPELLQCLERGISLLTCLKDGMVWPVWRQLLELCHKSNACLRIMLEEEQAASCDAQQRATLLQQQLEEARQQLVKTQQELADAHGQLAQARAAEAALLPEKTRLQR